MSIIKIKEMKRLELRLCKGVFAIMVLLLSLVCIVGCSDDDNEDLRGVCEVSGMVVDLDGSPLEGVKVRIYPEGVGNVGSSDGITDSEGNYHVVVNDATKILVISYELEGYIDGTITVNNISFTDGLPGESLGKANIHVEDIRMIPKNKK